jgi:hypothetical protein
MALPIPHATLLSTCALRTSPHIGVIQERKKFFNYPYRTCHGTVGRIQRT